MEKSERPPAIEDGQYWIGRFEITVVRDTIQICPRQMWSHNHQNIDTMIMDHFDGERYSSIKLKHNKDSNEAEHRILKLISSGRWKPRRYKSK